MGVGVDLLALQALADGRTALGWVVMVCGVVGAASGTAALAASCGRR